MKRLAKESDGKIRCLGENTEKYITFPVTLNRKVTKIDKGDNDEAKIIPYKLSFIYSFRFLSTLLSSLVDNSAAGLHSDKCIDCKSCLEYMSANDNQWNFIQLILRWFECKKEKYQKDFNKDLINRSASTYEYCNKDINTSIFLIRKGVYPYEYMNIWERIN